MKKIFYYYIYNSAHVDNFFMFGVDLLTYMIKSIKTY